MTNPTDLPAQLPPDDPSRALAVARPDTGQSLPHLAVGDATYTILLAGPQTGGRFTLIDMLVPPGGGPPRHRHDFEETFVVLGGEIELGFRDERLTLHSGETVNIPANAPHQFWNKSERAARLLCLCAPAGQEEFFLAVGVPVASRTTLPPPLDEAALQAFREKGLALAAKYHSEFLPPL